MRAEGVLIATRLASLNKEASVGGLVQRGFSAARRHPVRTAVGTLAAIGAGAGIGAAVGGDGIKVRGGMLYLDATARAEFFRILKAQGPVEAAKYALRMLKDGKGRFVRGTAGPAPMKTAEEEKLASLSGSIKGFSNALSTFAKEPANKDFIYKSVLGGAALASGAGLMGLGAEVINRSLGGALKGVHSLGADRRYEAAKAWVRQLTPPDQLAAMGLGTETTALGPSSPESRAREAAQQKRREANFRLAFNLLDQHAPLTTSSPVITALVLRDVVSFGEPPNRGQIRDMLELESQLTRNKELGPFRVRASAGSEQSLLGKVVASTLGSGD